MSFFCCKKSRKVKRIVAFATAIGLLLTAFMSNGENALGFLKGEEIFASQTKSQTQQELDEVKNRLEELEEEQEEVEAELDAKTEELSALLADKEILENELTMIQASINQAKIDLEDAKEKEAEEYESMKLRIQYMYENSTQDSMIDAVLNANGIVDLLNRVEYISQVYTSDRELLENYKKQVEEVEYLASGLEANKSELLTAQEIYEHQEEEIEKTLAELKTKSSNYESQIKAAQKKAKQLAKEIEEQNQAIANQNSGGGSSSNSTVSTTGGYLTDASYDPAFRTNISGQQLVNFALQYVGYPYKYGGNSLTNGCDCSGFVNLVYAHFGITVPRQSYAFRSCGQPVAYANLKAGDIVVYPGHVAIYIGNGKIVEAQSTKAGITCTRSVTCSTITAIRRVL